MSKMEVLGALEAEKLTKQKCKHYYGTPCIGKTCSNFQCKGLVIKTLPTFCL